MVAQNTLRFIKLLQVNSQRIKVPRRYSSELNSLIGQIVDIARMVLLQTIGTGSSPDPSGSQQEKPVVPPLERQSQPSMTSGTATLNIIQIQRRALNEERLQSQMSHLIKKMLDVRAKRVEDYDKLHEEEKGESSTALKEGKKESTIELKSFVGEFQSQVLGIGKAPVQNQNRFGGGGGQTQQNLSYPSNAMADSIFQRVFQRAIESTCDVIVKQEKQAAAGGVEGQRLVKNRKEAAGTARIQLKPQQSLEAGEAASDDASIYVSLFEELKQASQPWYDEVQEFVSKQDPGSRLVVKLVRSEAEALSDRP
jgi:hypothetical protein